MFWYVLICYNTAKILCLDKINIFSSSIIDYMLALFDKDRVIAWRVVDTSCDISVLTSIIVCFSSSSAK